MVVDRGGASRSAASPAAAPKRKVTKKEAVEMKVKATESKAAALFSSIMKATGGSPSSLKAPGKRMPVARGRVEKSRDVGRKRVNGVASGRDSDRRERGSIRRERERDTYGRRERERDDFGRRDRERDDYGRRERERDDYGRRDRDRDDYGRRERDLSRRERENRGSRYQDSSEEEEEEPFYSDDEGFIDDDDDDDDGAIGFEALQAEEERSARLALLEDKQERKRLEKGKAEKLRRKAEWERRYG